MSEHTTPFRLMNYQQRGDDTTTLHTGLVLGDRILSFEALSAYYPIAQKMLKVSTSSVLTPGIEGLLVDWDQSFQELSELAALVAQHQGEESSWQKESVALEEVHVLSPVIRPTKMLFAGANYERHLKEGENWDAWKASGAKSFQSIDKSTTKPYAFIKLPYNIIGPYDSVVYPYPHHQLDWEGELGLVIGRRGKHIPVESAMDYVAGFVIVNDYSLRDLTLRADWPSIRTDWIGGKNFDTSACLGPYMVPKQFVPNYLDLHLTLSVNGVTKQDSSTQFMVFKPDEIIAFLSSIVTLEPGDIISTGTPEGVGVGRGEFLKVGDVVETEIEGLGRQRNSVVTEAETTMRS
jgi:2,4-didehydro-3-deoxy-L-rhamnonate hydrolase